MVAVFEQRGWIWGEKGAVIQGSTTFNTKTDPIAYVPAHSLYAWPSELYGRREGYQDFDLFEIPRDLYHTTDIHTMNDLRLARLAVEANLVRY